MSFNENCTSASSKYLNDLTWEDFIAGWTSGICSTSIGHPLETIKVRQQIIPNFHSASRLAVLILKNEGVKGFFKGLSYPLWTTGILNSIYFGVYANSLRILENKKGERHFRNCTENGPVYKGWHFDCVLAGCIGGGVCAIINTPIELSKTVLQAHSVTKSDYMPDKKFTPKTFLVKLFKSQGLRGCYHGGWILLCRDVPSFGIYGLCYEHIAGKLKKTNSHSHLMNACYDGIAGGCSGVISWLIGFPLDVIKSRYMYDSINLKNRKYSGILDCIRKTYKMHGAAAFHKGLSITLMRAFPVNLLCFITYEETLHFL
ncbi:hypothetical protein PGB90_002471 [Kerria lacca]